MNECDARVENWSGSTYGGILRNGTFSENRIADLVIFLRDGEEFGIYTLKAVWKSDASHDGTMYYA